MKIYVGNLSFDTTDSRLESAFAAYGNVASAQVIVDRFNTNSRGFGFVEMTDDDQANAAMVGLNRREFHGRELRVNEAQARSS
jgi:cold-inducible RNA-binding protein